jgi:hypothetical protein
MIQLYQYHCHGTGFAMPLPDITSESTVQKKIERTPLRCGCVTLSSLPICPLGHYVCTAFLAAFSTLAESLLEESLLFVLFCCSGSCGRWQASALGSKCTVATTELDGCADRRCLGTCGWVSTRCTVSLAARHSVTAIGVTGILLHDRRSVVDVVTVGVGLLRNTVSTVEGAVLAAGICRVCPRPSTVAVLSICVVRVVVSMLRVESVCAVGTARRVHASGIWVTAVRSSGDTDVRVTVLTTRCIVTAAVLRAIFVAGRIVVCGQCQRIVGG